MRLSEAVDIIQGEPGTKITIARGKVEDKFALKEILPNRKLKSDTGLVEPATALGRQVAAGAPAPDDDLQAIRTSAILLGLRQLALWLSPARGYPLSEPLVQRRIAELSHLLDGKPSRPER